jgi:hypothetical protein
VGGPFQCRSDRGNDTRNGSDDGELAEEGCSSEWGDGPETYLVVRIRKRSSLRRLLFETGHMLYRVESAGKMVYLIHGGAPSHDPAFGVVLMVGMRYDD